MTKILFKVNCKLIKSLKRMNERFGYTEYCTDFHEIVQHCNKLSQL